MRVYGCVCMDACVGLGPTSPHPQSRPLVCQHAASGPVTRAARPWGPGGSGMIQSRSRAAGALLRAAQAALYAGPDQAVGWAQRGADAAGPSTARHAAAALPRWHPARHECCGAGHTAHGLAPSQEAQELECWSCQHFVKKGGVVCNSCDKLQPIDASLNYFELLVM
jgi:hypothetical protein